MGLSKSLALRLYVPEGSSFKCRFQSSNPEYTLESVEIVSGNLHLKNGHMWSLEHTEGNIFLCPAISSVLLNEHNQSHSHPEVRQKS